MNIFNFIESDSFFFSPEVKSKWLAAHNDFVAGIHTVGTCMELVDLFAEGSVNLVLADFGNILLMPKLQVKLKVFKGKKILFQYRLNIV